jgi:hypothetical protein
MIYNPEVLKNGCDVLHFYTLVLRLAVLCDWVWQAGIHTGFEMGIFQPNNS